MPNVLIMGINSQLAKILSRQYKRRGYSLYGVTTNLNTTFDANYTKVIGYDDSFNGVTFSEVLIAGSRVPAQGGSFEDFLRDNLKIAVKAVELGGKARYVFISSFSVYDQLQPLIEITTPYTNSDPYGISKLICEKYLQDRLGDELLILRVPVLLCQGVKNNFLANLKYQIETNGEFNFSSQESKVNAFFTTDDYFKVLDSVDSGIVNCRTKLDWKISDLIEFSLTKGLSKFKVVPPKKPPQIVVDCPIEFSSTSEALINFLNGTSNA